VAIFKMLKYSGLFMARVLSRPPRYGENTRHWGTCWRSRGVVQGHIPWSWGLGSQTVICKKVGSGACSPSLVQGQSMLSGSGGTAPQKVKALLCTYLFLTLFCGIVEESACILCAISNQKLCETMLRTRPLSRINGYYVV